jgi:hypothetical protein
MMGIPFLFGKIASLIGYDQPHIKGTSCIDPRIINLVQDAMTDREPNAAACHQRSSNSGFGARRPTSGHTWSAGRSYGLSICHRTILAFKIAEDLRCCPID